MISLSFRVQPAKAVPDIFASNRRCYQCKRTELSRELAGKQAAASLAYA